MVLRQQARPGDPVVSILGRHLLVDLHECDPERLHDPDSVEQALLDAARASGATILGHQFHRFQPHGVSGVVLIAESHLSIHTWPEHGYAAVDFFTCGPGMRPEVGVDVLTAAFGCRRAEVNEVRRGTGGFAPAER